MRTSNGEDSFWNWFRGRPHGMSSIDYYGVWTPGPVHLLALTLLFLGCCFVLGLTLR